MKKLTKGLVLVFVLALALGLAGCGDKKDAEKKDTSLEDVKKAGVLTVGTSADYPPYEFHMLGADGNDKIVGADIEIAKLIAEKLGVKMELTDMSFDGLLISLNEDKFDMVMAGLTKDPERKVLFSDNYNAREQAVIIRKEDMDKYKSVEDLKGKKVGGQRGTVQADLAEQFTDKPIILTKFPDMIAEVKMGKEDAMISDDDVAQVYVKANPDLAIANIKIDYDNADVAIAFKEGNNALCNEVNKIIADLKADGTITKLMEEASTLAAQEETKNSAAANK